MKRYRVILTPFAADNIREAHAWYLAESPAHAETWLEGIEAAILGLETFPEAHGLAPESRALGRDIRQLLCGSGRRWRVFFVVEKKTVRVLHVRHGNRDYWLP